MAFHVFRCGNSHGFHRSVWFIVKSHVWPESIFARPTTSTLCGNIQCLRFWILISCIYTSNTHSLTQSIANIPHRRTLSKRQKLQQRKTFQISMLVATNATRWFYSNKKKWKSCFTEKVTKHKRDFAELRTETRRRRLPMCVRVCVCVRLINALTSDSDINT